MGTNGDDTLGTHWQGDGCNPPHPVAESSGRQDRWRRDAINAAAKAIRKADPDAVAFAAAAAAVDAVDPIIRADERAKVAREEVMIYARAWDEVSDEAFEKVNAYDQLRAKVESLPSRVELDLIGDEVTWVRYADVLAMFARGDT